VSCEFPQFDTSNGEAMLSLRALQPDFEAAQRHMVLIRRSSDSSHVAVPAARQEVKM
jgi:hypothetical protein